MEMSYVMTMWEISYSILNSFDSSQEVLNLGLLISNGLRAAELDILMDILIRKEEPFALLMNQEKFN